MGSNIGKKIDGRYEISEIISEGIFTSVYKCVDLLDDNKAVVIKTFDDFICRAPSKAIAKLSHPNIVKTYDVVSSKEEYIVMEYVNGITLKDYIKEKKVLTWKDTVYIVIQILRALQYAHDKRIVHLGIKPEKIMMLIDGTIKVMDFHRELLDSFADVKRDIYSVGAMMYEMLTGKKPPENDISKNFRDDIPDGLKKIFIKAMENYPKDSYQTIADMLADMEKFNEDSVFAKYIQLEICMIALKKYTDAFNKSLDTVNMFNYKSIIERASDTFDVISEELSMSHLKLEQLRYVITKFAKRYSDNVHTIEILKREIKECDNLHKKYDNLLERFIYLSKEYTNLNEEYDNLNKEHDALNIECDNVRKEYDTLNKEHDSLNIECDNLRKEYDNLNKEHDALNIECDNLHKECDNLNKSYDNLLEKYIHQTREYSNLYIECDNLRKEHDNLNKEHDSLNIECDNLRKEHDNLNKEHDSLNIECDNLRKEYDNLNIEYNKLNKECNALKKELVKKELEKYSTIKIKTFYKLDEHEKANIYDRKVGKYIKMLFK